MPPDRHILLKFSLAAVLLLGAIVILVQWRGVPEPRKATLAQAERILKAVEHEDYEAFVALADPQVRRMRVENFRLLARQHAPRLRKGHQLQLRDERWRGTVHVSRWTITFTDGGPNAIVTLGLRDGRVATFALY
jgi:hypothetical protein